MLRHPPVQGAAGICYGRLDLALAPGWEGWCETLAVRLKGMVPTRIWSSPSSRCASVAEALASRLDTPVILDGRLRELDFGQWEGVAWADLPRAEMDLWASDPLAFRPPGGETGAQLIDRVNDFADTLCSEVQRCIVISHGGPLRLLPALLRDEKPDLLAASPSLGSLSILRVGG